MSVDLPKVRLGIYTWIERELVGTDVTSDRIFWTRPNAPRPARPCIGLDIPSGPSQTAHDQRVETSPGVWTVSGQRRITITVIAYGGDADILISRLHSSLEKETTRSILSRYGLGMVRQDDVTDTAVLVDSGFENRFQFDVVFHAVSNTVDSVGYVENVEVTNENTGTTDILGP